MSKKTKTVPDEQTVGLLASVAELAGVVRTKDEALSVLQAIVDQQAERIAELVESAVAPVSTTTVPGKIGTLDEAIMVLRAHGFQVLTEVKVEAGIDESGQRLRTFRNPSRYEFALVRKTVP